MLNTYSIFITFLIYSTHLSNGDTHTCNENNQCPTQINCLSNEKCVVKCASDNACKDKTINCASNQECEVHCINPSATNQCNKITINAQLSSYLLINASMGNSSNFLTTSNISNTQPYTIQYANIYCPSNGPFTTPQEKACDINCDGDDLFRFTNIYAIEGFNDFAITSTHYQKNFCFRKVTIYCKSLFNSSCTSITDMNTNTPHECDGSSIDTTCNNYIVTNSPTISPTNPTFNPSVSPIISPTLTPTNIPSTYIPTTNPSNIPTYSPSINPSKTPTYSPSINPSKYPTHSPSTNIPTKNPSSTPTHLPSTNPTIYPTIYPTISPITFSPTTYQPTTITPSFSPTTFVPTQYPTITTNPTVISPTTLIPTNFPTINPSDITFTPSINPTTSAPSIIITTLNPSIYPTTSAPSTFITTTHTTQITSTTTDQLTTIITTLQSIGPTQQETTAYEDNNSPSKYQLQLDLGVLYTIVAIVLVFGVGCFAVGACFGMVISKKKVAKLAKGPHVEQQMSTLVNIKPKNNEITTEDLDRESLYADDIFEAKSIDIQSLSPQRKGNHVIVDSESVQINQQAMKQIIQMQQIPQLQIIRQSPAHTVASGEIDDKLDLNDSGFKTEYALKNPPPVYIESNYQNRNNSLSLQSPAHTVQIHRSHNNINQLPVQHVPSPIHKHNNQSDYKQNFSDNVSVNYAHADHEIDEKENKVTKQGTPGQHGNITVHGINQPDIFPNDEGTIVAFSKYGHSQQLSVGYNSLKHIDDHSHNYKSDDDDDDDAGRDHYNSDPDEDEDEKNLQNEATLGIEIEMQTNTPYANAQINANHKKGEASKTLDKLSLDENGIAPLSSSINMSVRYSKSGQHLMSIISPQKNRIEKSFQSNSKSQISSTHKSGNSFITVFQEQKDGFDDDDDYDALNDPEYEQEMHFKMHSKPHIEASGGY